MNALTVTKEGFCNFQHTDRDAHPATYGEWWEAVQLPDGRWIFHPKVDHNKTRGGEFVWGAYGVGVDFARFFISSLFSTSSDLILSQSTGSS